MLLSAAVLGLVPKIFKHATVQPLIKKPGLDPSALSNFRPISKFPFISNVLEKMIYNQMKAFLHKRDCKTSRVSFFKSLHGTESSLLRVFKDILLTSSQIQGTIIPGSEIILCWSELIYILFCSFIMWRSAGLNTWASVDFFVFAATWLYF